MAIITRYIFRQSFSALMLILASLTGVVWIALALKQLQVVTSSGQDALTFLTLTTLAVPNLIGFVAPIGLLIAAIHVLNRLNGDSELIILTASGATIWWVARPLIALAVLVSLLVTAINFYIMPSSLKRVREMIVEVRTDLIAQVLEPGNFSKPEDGVVIHVRDRTLDGTLLGILFHDARKPKDIVSITADRGRIVKDNGLPYLQMLDGHIVRQADAIGPSEIIRFESYVLELDSFQKREGPISWKPRERFLGELLNPDPEDKRFKRHPGKFRAEIHERFSGPLYPLAFVLIALASVGQAQSTRSNRTQALAAGFVSAVVVRLMGFAANNLVAINAWAVPLMYLVPIAGGLIAVGFMYANAWPKPGPTRMQRITFALEDAFGALAARFKRNRAADGAARTPAE